MRQVTKPRRSCSSSTQTRVAKIVHHNMGCGGIPIRPAPVPQPQQGSCERSGGCTTQKPCRPQSPRLFGPSPQDYGLTPCSGFCQKGQELPGLLRPPAANLPSQDHQPSSSARVGQLGVGSLLPTPGRNQDCSIHVGGPGMRRTVTMQSRHEGGVHRKLGASEQGQPVCQDLDSSSVLGIWICQVKISEHGIRDHSAACLPADASPGALHCVQRFPTWDFEPMTPFQIPRNSDSCLQRWRWVRTSCSVDDRSGHFRCLSRAGAVRAAKTHSSNRERHCDDVLHNLVDLAWHDVHDAAETVEQTCVVPFCEFMHQFWPHHSQPPAQCKSNAHADCKSWVSGLRARRTSSSSNFSIR